ncbi:TfpX/TfpZ family type IV pilin accessory protein [Stutzerimonas degradans]|uniref:Type IV pilin accessory protein n=1 Tax=Stutzerimonas degradans TaxID=2968968 RepID=A0A8E2QGA3_9GAMM|nr:TfpX/TfpZ family type IV pilin accessory protein [Stutzerimonas degradans]MCQ4275011.1 type IV pilin accessory protein [Stutzerimonas degradans]PNF78273.1 type IV pilin accessory protein [Stutzerimonas degradans]QPT20134.1 type IV pilin accessory protein [Stutzerimonas degradans]
MPARLKAFRLHLAASALIALFARLWVFKLWYPAPLHEALGVTQIFLLLLLVDVILGPLLTLLMYKVGKKTLVMDLAVIVTLQLAALGYGLWTVAEGRPAWIVYNADRFDVVTVVDIDTRQLHETQPHYRNAPWTGPRWVGATRPDKIEQRNNILFEATLGGSDIAQRPNLYRPLEEMSGAIQQRARPLASLNTVNAPATVQATLQKWPAATAWVPLMARSQPMVVLLGKDKSEVISIVKLNPWQ